MSTCKCELIYRPSRRVRTRTRIKERFPEWAKFRCNGIHGDRDYLYECARPRDRRLSSPIEEKKEELSWNLRMNEGKGKRDISRARAFPQKMVLRESWTANGGEWTTTIRLKSIIVKNFRSFAKISFPRAAKSHANEVAKDFRRGVRISASVSSDHRSQTSGAWWEKWSAFLGEHRMSAKSWRRPCCRKGSPTWPCAVREVSGSSRIVWSCQQPALTFKSV